MYVISENDVLLDVVLAKDMYIRPPYEKGYLLKESKIGSVEMTLAESDMKDKVSKE